MWFFFYFFFYCIGTIRERFLRGNCLACVKQMLSWWALADSNSQVWEQLKLASFLSWSNWKQWKLVHVRCSLSSLVVFRSCYINNTLWMMWECAWVTVYASLCREWKWHLREKQSGNPLTSVKSALICWWATANLLTSIPESSVTVKEKEVRVLDWCDPESRPAFTPALLLFPKHSLYVVFIAPYSTSKKNPSLSTVVFLLL